MVLGRVEKWYLCKSIAKSGISLLQQLQENSRSISWQPSPEKETLKKATINLNYDHYNLFGLISGQSSEVTRWLVGMAATIWLEDFRSNHLWVSRWWLAKASTLWTAARTHLLWWKHIIYIYVACLSHIRSCFTLECCKYFQFFHRYLQAGLLHTLQQGSCLWLPFNREGYSALQGTPWQSSYKWPTCRSWAMWTMQLARFVPCLLNSQGANVRAVPLCFTNLGCVSLFMKSLRCCMARSIIP